MAGRVDADGVGNAPAKAAIRTSVPLVLLNGPLS